MIVPPRVYEQRAHARALRHVRDLLPSGPAPSPARARVTEDDLADALLELCSDGTSAEGVARLSRGRSARAPSSDLLHLRMRGLTHEALLEAFRAANAEILAYARRMNLLPRAFEAAVASTRFSYWGAGRDQWVAGGRKTGAPATGTRASPRIP